jgi:hypothetical protein
MEIKSMIAVLRKAYRMSFCVGVMIMLSSCFPGSYTRLSGSVTISDEWVTLSPDVPLKAEKTHQWVSLELESPFRTADYDEGNGPNRGDGIWTPGGDVINPEIQVIDQYGNTFSFVYMGTRGAIPIYGYSNPEDLPRDREYKTVRIRSPKPVKCKAIYWFCESQIGWK